MTGWTFPNEVLKNFIKNFDNNDYLWELAEELQGWNIYNKDDEEELIEAVNAVFSYYKNNDYDFCEFLTKLDDSYRPKDYEEKLNGTIKKIYYYIQGDGEDFEGFMIPLLACYYYDKPGNYDLNFENRQTGYGYRNMVIIKSNGNYIA